MAMVGSFTVLDGIRVDRVVVMFVIGRIVVAFVNGGIFGKLVVAIGVFIRVVVVLDDASTVIWL